MSLLSLELSDIVWVAVVTVLHNIQLMIFTLKVGKMRYKHKVNFPATTGHPEFERTFRAQMNCVEFYGTFMTMLWISALFTHQVPAALVGLLYVIGRQKYFYGYMKEVKGRLAGFKFVKIALQLFLVLSISGLVQFLAKMYLGYDIKAQVRPFINPLLKNLPLKVEL